MNEERLHDPKMKMGIIETFRLRHGFDVELDGKTRIRLAEKYLHEEIGSIEDIPKWVEKAISQLDKFVSDEMRLGAKGIIKRELVRMGFTLTSVDEALALLEVNNPGVTFKKILGEPEDRAEE